MPSPGHPIIPKPGPSPPTVFRALDRGRRVRRVPHPLAVGSDSISQQCVRFTQTLSPTDRVLPPVKKMIASQSRVPHPLAVGLDSNSLQRVRFAQTLNLTARVLPPAKKMIASQSGQGIRIEGSRYDTSASLRSPRHGTIRHVFLFPPVPSPARAEGHTRIPCSANVESEIDRMEL